MRKNSSKKQHLWAEASGKSDPLLSCISETRARTWQHLLRFSPGLALCKRLAEILMLAAADAVRSRVFPGYLLLAFTIVIMKHRDFHSCLSHPTRCLALFLVTLTCGCESKQEPVAQDGKPSANITHDQSAEADTKEDAQSSLKSSANSAPSQTEPADKSSGTSRDQTIEKSQQRLNAGDYAGASETSQDFVAKGPHGCRGFIPPCQRHGYWR